MLRGKPSRMKPLAASGWLQALANHAEHGGIVDQLAGVHGGLGAQAQFRALGNGLAQQVAGGYLRDSIGFDQQLRLCAFAGSGRSQ